MADIVEKEEDEVLEVVAPEGIYDNNDDASKGFLKRS